MKKFYDSPDLATLRSTAKNGVLTALTSVPNMHLDYLNFSYYLVDDCKTHTTTFPPNTAVFVDNFCGTINIVGSDVGEVNIIENHGNITTSTTGSNLKWITVFKNYKTVTAKGPIEKFDLINAYKGSKVTLSKLTQDAYVSDLKSGAILRIENCDRGVHHIWAGAYCGSLYTTRQCHDKLEIWDSYYKYYGCTSNHGAWSQIY